ncbi:uncharacterized protein LOC130713295 [Lotus japonicus]|uniref:uncharacterized protein LOC130713295 n=1 Tax=Lotus japonicus TaxID=34305 RepID=UPI00258FCDD7|nr:uncharacterized protein LOC130713295 [Lotus japonicus]
MGYWEDGRWCWKFEWQRNLLEREEPRVVDMMKRIGSFSPKLDVCDSWCWVKDGSGLYTVKSAYVELQGNSGVEEKRVFRRTWQTTAPSGHKALAWRVLINRVQTRYDLAKRNAIPSNASLMCGLCASEEENSMPLFFNCRVSWGVWMKVCRWMGCQTVMAVEAESHFNQFEFLLTGSKKAGQILNMIWIATVNSIWQKRNGSIFRGENVECDEIVDLTQYKLL